MGEALRLVKAGGETPDYLPARMVNEYAYCRRLFYYEWVQGVFRESADTEEGKQQHRRVDREGAGLPAAGEEVEERIHARSITLASDRHRLIARMDLVELEGRVATPVDYKHGRPRETERGLELWEPDRVQLAVQAIVLRENGYQCEEGVVFYQKTRQRVRVAMTEELIARTLALVEEAWQTARSVEMPAPLEDSPKCGGCSLAPVCLPDETGLLRQWEPNAEDERQLLLFGAPKKPARAEVRRMVTARDDLRPVYLNTQGLRVGKSGGVLQVKEKDVVVQEVRLGEICQLNLMGNIQITTQAVQTLCEAGIPISYFSQGGWFYGVTTGMTTKNVFLRREQFRLAEEEWFCLRLARQLVAGKIRNQRVMLLRNHVEPDERALVEMKEMAGKAERAASLEELLGIEGNAARLYFSQFAGMLKGEDGENNWVFDFNGRNRRPPRDPVNALLSLGYSLLAKDLMVVCHAVGFDPMLGFYHQPRFGRPALALDLMEPFRPLIADSAVLTALNSRMVNPGHFIQTGEAVALTAEGRKGFFRAYELRMDTLVTHPIFEYRVSYRRLLEIQARLLMRVLDGEVAEYPVFVTR
jgi:CRISPR-associated protein Cas1